MNRYEAIAGIWVKAKLEYIEKFINNWEKYKKEQAFCVYDLPPVLPKGGVVFLHAIGKGRLVAYARYAGYEYIKGWYEHIKGDDKLWIEERERVWRNYGPSRLHTEDKRDFNNFWKDQMGVRGLFLMKDIKRLPEEKQIPWDVSMIVLQVYRPIGFSYKYLTNLQVEELFKHAGLEIKVKIKGVISPKVVLIEK